MAGLSSGAKPSAAPPACSAEVWVNDAWSIAASGTCCFPSFHTKPFILNSRPNWVRCGPNAPTWHVAQGWPVCRAKLGTAFAGAAKRTRTVASERTIARATGAAYAVVRSSFSEQRGHLPVDAVRWVSRVSNNFANTRPAMPGIAAALAWDSFTGVPTTISPTMPRVPWGMQRYP